MAASNPRDVHGCRFVPCAFVAALSQGPDINEQILAPASSSSIRKTEAAIVELKDGRLLLANTDFYTVSPNDDAPARILGRYSSDLGKTWGPTFILVENTAKMNVMSVSLLRLQSGELALTYMFKNSHEDCSVLYRLSKDKGKRFSEPIEITPTRAFGSRNDQLVQLRSGRLLAPCQRLDNWPKVRHSLTQVLYSDDKGKTWNGSKLVDIRDNGDGADEPGVVELEDGRILMYFRTDLGRIYQSFSSDKGVSWTTPVESSLVAPVSPSVIKRVPNG